MKIKSAEFVISNTDPKLCPKPDKPEFAFMGRSNVGKSSLINMLTNRKALAKISETPGKTRLINHFLINNSWYLADLPGYGYAKTSKNNRRSFLKIINDYLIARENLYCVFVLIDSRHEPLSNDLQVINQLGQNGIPIALIFTKTDKLSENKLSKNINIYKKELLKSWQEVPSVFLSSAINRTGRDEILNFIESSIVL